MDICLCNALFSLLLLILCVIYASPIRVRNYKRQTPGKTFTESLSHKLGQQRGVLACSDICSGIPDGDCLGFVFDKSGKHCELLLRSKYGSDGAKLTSRPEFVQYNDPSYPVLYHSCDELSKEETPPTGPVYILTADSYMLEVYCRQHKGAGVWYTFPSGAAIRQLDTDPPQSIDTSLFFTDHMQFLLVFKVKTPATGGYTQGSMVIKQYQNTIPGTTNDYIDIPFELSFNADKGKHKDEKPQMYVLVTAAERTVAGSPTGLNINGQDSVYGNGHHHERGFTLFAAASATVVPSDSQDFTLSDKNVITCYDLADAADDHPLTVDLPPAALMPLAMDLGHEDGGADKEAYCYISQAELDSGRVVSAAIGFY